MENKLDWFDWVEEVVHLLAADVWDLNVARYIAESFTDLHEQGDSPEEAYRKYQEGEV